MTGSSTVIKYPTTGLAKPLNHFAQKIRGTFSNTPRSALSILQTIHFGRCNHAVEVVVVSALDGVLARDKCPCRTLHRRIIAFVQAIPCRNSWIYERKPMGMLYSPFLYYINICEDGDRPTFETRIVKLALDMAMFKHRCVHIEANTCKSTFPVIDL